MAVCSPAVQHVYKLIGQVAGSDTTVLIRGESGIGTELVVNAIRFNSGRSKTPLVKVNCASILETLLESELFGHEKAYRSCSQSGSTAPAVIVNFVSAP